LSDQEVLIGRDPDATICLNNRAVSRRHCVVRREDGRFVVHDLGSHNGTFVNNMQVTEHVLQHGDVIAVSGYSFIFAEGELENRLEPQVTEFAASQTLEYAAVRQAEPLLEKPASLLATSRQREEARHELELILELNRQAASLREPDELQHALLDLAFEITPAESAAVLLYQEPDAPATSTVGRSRSGRSAEAIQVSRTVIRRVLAEKVAVLARDVSTDATLEKAQSIIATGIRSILCVPLLSGKRAIGVLYLDVRRPGAAFDQRHLELLTGVAAVVALSLERALDYQRMRAQTQLLRADLDQDRAMVGESAAIKKIYDLIAKVAASDTTVLILGESGTGKEVAARAVHRNSRRAEKAFVAVNCATLGDNLLESELFGHERGAFTGAVGLKKGLLEAADGGTVFMDEVAELPLTVQAKLLRVLQEREFTRLGSTRPIRVDIRLIAATNKDLRAAVANGAFREDLWHRLNVVSVKMPKLRERMEDIRLLANFFLAKASRRCGRRVIGFSPEAMAVLRQHDWPGNVRELENAIERAVVLGSEPEIQVSDLPENLWESAPVAAGPMTYHAALREAKLKIVKQALEDAGGNYTEASRKLGVHVTYLHRLMRGSKEKTAGQG
ncbi:MAG TPA: sigma 54-interacting transcriptional regulator, partial [Candidatus Angelobacter sp.]|nr:sigma 54-interacting transcriptional regulator [Candidatus Angelobacter sp.]